MRTESSLSPGVMAADAPSWWRRGDVVAAVLLFALPAVIFGVPALLGHPIVPGDDLTQNLPRRPHTRSPGCSPSSPALRRGRST
jgi:hypothetical protein